tara:strand:- start:1053 stop:1463 length:411 start_codon:yes stop_codon:yes gene_type:complete
MAMGSPFFPGHRKKEQGVANPEWGTKRECRSCGARFYDLKRDPVVCPKCETVFVIEAPKPKPPVQKKPEVQEDVQKAKAVNDKGEDGPESDLADVEVDDEGEDEDNAFVDDASELEDTEDVGLGINTDIKEGEGER